MSVSSKISLVERRLQALIFERDSVTYGPIRVVTLAPSKRIRAALCLISAQAVQLPTAIAIELAAAIELLHTFSLVHDDIEDNAEIRRGHASVHVVDGVPIAINAGDALHAASWSAMLALDAPPQRVLVVARLFAQTLERMVEGQARDLTWTRDRRIGLGYHDYLAMVRGKSGALLGFAAAAPAALNNHGGADRLYQFGVELGTALQLMDDVAGLRGTSRELGKPVGPSTNGAASGPALLATEPRDGVVRAIELAHDHVDLACEHLEAAGVADSKELQVFADAMLGELLLRSHAERAS